MLKVQVLNSTIYEMAFNVFSEAFAKRRVQISYFYTDDDSIPKAGHYYPNESAVGITVRENQEPLDEFVCIVFEAINSENEKPFQEIVQQAQQGLISRERFARDILRLEFNAVLKTRDLLKRLKLNVGDMSTLYLYKHMMECPDTFDEFLTYTKAISPNHQRDPLEEYEKQYDLMQKP
jgi:hypothetical protein